jgi:hypothetical protein
MFYSELSEGVKHFKETEGGRKVMCKAVEEYGDMRAAEAAEAAAEEQQLESVKNLMDTMKLTLEQAMNALKIPEEDRNALIKRLVNAKPSSVSSDLRHIIGM